MLRAGAEKVGQVQVEQVGELQVWHIKTEHLSFELLALLHELSSLNDLSL